MNGAVERSDVGIVVVTKSVNRAQGGRIDEG